MSWRWQRLTSLAWLAYELSMEHWLFIDPSVRACGWARFRIASDSAELRTSGVVKGSRDGIAVLDVAAAGVDRCWIEEPGVQGGARGTAARNAGDILVLMMQVGLMAGHLRERGVVVETIPVPMWKGNLPKEVCARRVERWWGVAGLDHNEMDAIALGDWYIRRKRRLAIKRRDMVTA